MHRDMDLIRGLLLKLESIPKNSTAVMILDPYSESFSFDGYTEDQINYHLNLINEAGLIDDANARTMTGIGFRRLSWAGHDFVDSIRDPEVWAKTKKGAALAGGFTMDLLKDLAKGFIKKKVEELTDIKL